MKNSIIAIATAFGMLAPSAALAEYPEKPVSFVVPWPPGDLEDVPTRMIAEDFQKEHGVAAAIVNKPGGGGGTFPGATSISTAPADGCTIGSFVMGVPMLGQVLGIPELEPEQFNPLGIFLTYPFVLAASADAPYSTKAELTEYAKTNYLALGHFGVVTVPAQVSFAYAKKSSFAWETDVALDVLDCNSLLPATPTSSIRRCSRSFRALAM